MLFFLCGEHTHYCVGINFNSKCISICNIFDEGHNLKDRIYLKVLASYHQCTQKQLYLSVELIASCTNLIQASIPLLCQLSCFSRRNIFYIKILEMSVREM